jgi:adenosylcobinamide kinase / adenosylcobinamide-phosphate guanylyltransferase
LETPNHLILVTGPARSGKSEWAELLASQTGRSVLYVATARENPDDPEWQARIEQHRQRRPLEWQTLSIPINLTDTIQKSTPRECLLIDSLGTWLANLLDQDLEAWAQTQDQLLIALQNRSSSIVLVAEETGWGVVPAYPIGRQFRDRLGTLIRRIGAIADQVYLVTGGYALDLRVLGTPLPSSMNTLFP